jgi:hypothetical protein
MTLNARQSARARPAAIAIHYDGNMARNRFKAV